MLEGPVPELEKKMPVPLPVVFVALLGSVVVALTGWRYIKDAQEISRRRANRASKRMSVLSAFVITSPTLLRVLGILLLASVPLSWVLIAMQINKYGIR